MKLVDHFQSGLDAPICLTWELTYACNLACVHCLSSSGRRDPRELSTEECKAVIDELERMQVFYVNIGGGEPTVRKDFWELVAYATEHRVGVKFSTNGSRVTAERAAWLKGNDYVDVQISLDRLLTAIPVISRNLDHSDAQHTRIVESILAGDATMARVTMEEHSDAEIAARLFPDAERFRAEEQRRFELLDAHWDVPLEDVPLE